MAWNWGEKLGVAAPQQAPQGQQTYAQPPQAYSQPQQYQQPYTPTQQAPQLTTRDLTEMVKSKQISLMQATNMLGEVRTDHSKRGENENCPECDSPNYFTRKGFKKRGQPASPMCMACGYNGMYDQWAATHDDDEG